MTVSLARMFGYVWAAPNTLLGIAIGLLLGGQFERVEGVLEVHGRHVARVGSDGRPRQRDDDGACGVRMRPRST